MLVSLIQRNFQNLVRLTYFPHFWLSTPKVKRISFCLFYVRDRLSYTHLLATYPRFVDSGTNCFITCNRSYRICLLLFILIFILAIRCPALSAPGNGDITPGICKTKPSHGQLCSYKCNPGYKIVGSTADTCQNGRWTQGSIQCQGKR